jgi:hypothetical protein
MHRHGVVLPDTTVFVTRGSGFAHWRKSCILPGVLRRLLFLLLLLPLAAEAAPPLAIEIDLTKQKAFLLQEGQIIYESAISSGRPKYRTPTGNFTITEKSPDHRSSLYGKIVDANGKTLVRDADSDMPVPAGAKFVNAPMKNFLRFDGSVGLHEGWIPGYPASHGCVRLPSVRAELFFNIVEVGTPVRVFGTPPETTPPDPTPRPAAAAAATPAPTSAASSRTWFPFIRKVTPTPKPR